jgi:sigma-E factor negative regulatory protein RseB
MRRAALCVAACLVAFSAHAEDADQDARNWLERMSVSLATLNYDGLFTHTTGRQVETMRIVHRVEQGRAFERLVSLDGSGREIVRTRDEVHAYLPDRRVVLVEPRGDEGSLLKALPTPGPKLDRFYDLSVSKGSRLLGREVRVIDVRPRDIYRYGYRLWLDEETAMPLQSIVADGAGNPIEHIRFTQLHIKDKIPARDIEPSVDATGFQWVRTGRKLAAMPQLPANGGWRPLRVPPGFRLVHAGPAPDLFRWHRCHFSLYRARRAVGSPPARVVHHGLGQRLLHQREGPRGHSHRRSPGGHRARNCQLRGARAGRSRPRTSSGSRHPAR